MRLFKRQGRQLGYLSQLLSDSVFNFDTNLLRDKTATCGCHRKLVHTIGVQRHKRKVRKRVDQIIHKVSFNSETAVGDKPNIHVLCEKWTKKFEEKGVSEPEMSAELIIAHVMGKKMINEVPCNHLIDEQTLSRVDQFCQQRLQRIPVQYIIGEWDFHNLVLKMREPVFIPRPETEELVDLVCEHIKSAHLTNGRFLDIGCGSGAISLYILSKLKKMTGVAIDKHGHACDLTKENACNLTLHKRLTVHQLDIFQKDVVEVLQKYLPFDIIVSNPPYIPTQHLTHLDPEVIRYESRDALDGGEDGLNIVRRILTIGPQILKTGGQIWLEVDLEEPQMIKSMMQNHSSICYVKTIKDFTKRDRFCVLEVM